MKRHEHRQQRRRQPNYMQAMLAGLNGLAGSKVYTLHVEHDAGCGIWHGKPCNCTPIVRKPEEVHGGN